MEIIDQPKVRETMTWTGDFLILFVAALLVLRITKLQTCVFAAIAIYFDCLYFFHVVIICFS